MVLAIMIFIWFYSVTVTAIWFLNIFYYVGPLLWGPELSLLLSISGVKFLWIQIHFTGFNKSLFFNYFTISTFYLLLVAVFLYSSWLQLVSAGYFSCHVELWLFFLQRPGGLCGLLAVQPLILQPCNSFSTHQVK